MTTDTWEEQHPYDKRNQARNTRTGAWLCAYHGSLFGVESAIYVTHDKVNLGILPYDLKLRLVPVPEWLHAAFLAHDMPAGVVADWLLDNCDLSWVVELLTGAVAERLESV